MKILIINPNSDPEMTRMIQETAPGMIELVRKNKAEYDGFIIACHADINLDVLKEITSTPVAGIGEASIKIAPILIGQFL